MASASPDAFWTEVSVELIPGIAHRGKAIAEMPRSPWRDHRFGRAMAGADNEVHVVEVELLDDDGLPIPGYSRDEARVINGNSVRMPVSWRKSGDVSRLAGTPVRLRFHMRDCRLYAFQFKPKAARSKSPGARP